MPGPRIVAVAALLAWTDQASSSVCEAMEEHASCAGSTDVGGTTQLQSTPDLHMGDIMQRVIFVI